ncbi:uncharacterized protein PHACADRAFT_253365 [Phanerochaete carnosa HHB-10118-sp]|uniref:GST N-terminal domain-containing protein n=1 Tax=Phanerochaete carnosa (strain HHB-10118-sp) TaxID=650164 RepID=K5V1F7_PHACS|nr:uncharacterized protein PHACADRAFT_253365 [Phanerochaete carnosa HHB-10118-sp]EKM56306.1 hypothetical protein PHACADRAFT_253365 [Phanerochaete carnosa HHB-10118-sp]
MAQAEQITFYTHAISLYCQTVHIALEEAKAEYTLYYVDLKDKPAFFVNKVNPVGKVPALTYGGPKVSPEQPSPESAKLRESRVILEFLADVFPDSGLLPQDPVLRARARLFIAVFDAQVFDAFKAYFWMNEPVTKLLDALDALQKLLPATGFVAGEKCGIADIAVAPLLSTMVALLENDLGVYPVGDGRNTLEVLRGEKFARFSTYIDDLQAQPSFKAVWNKDAQVASGKSNTRFQRK